MNGKTAAIYHKPLALGLCVRCRAPRVTAQYCEAHAKDNRAWYHKRIARGLCPGCKGRAEGTYRYCLACRTRRAERRKEANGC